MDFVFYSIIPLLIIMVFLIMIYKCINWVIKLKKGINLFNKGYADEAIKILSGNIKSIFSSTKAIGYALRGNCYFQMHKYKDALNDFSESTKLYKINLNMLLIGTFFCTFKEYDRALKYILKANELKPNSSEVYAQLGMVYYQAKEYDKAIENYNKALKYKGNKRTISNIYASLGAIYIRIKKYDNADKNLSKAFDIYPKCYGAYVNYAKLLRIKGNVSSAKENVSKAIKLNSYEYSPYRILAEINLTEDNYIEFYKNFKIFSEKTIVGIDNEIIEDLIFDKVKNDEEFKLLIKKSKENELTFDDLNVYIDDDAILSAANKNQKIIIYIIMALTILLMCIYQICVNHLKKFI